MSDKLTAELTEMGWVIEFPYTRRTKKLLTKDAIIGLMEKQIKSMNNEGLELFKFIIEGEINARAKPVAIHFDPFGNEAA